MSWSIVQSSEGTSTSATVTATLPSAPTSGNLIVLAFASDDYNGTPNTGWTQSTGMEQQTFHGGYLWWRISDGSNSFQYTIGSATNSAWVLLEISGNSATPYDISAGQFAQSSGISYTTPNLTPSTGDRLLIAMIGGSQIASVNMSGDLTAWTNSFTHIRSSGPASGSGTKDMLGVGYRVVTGDGSTAFSTGATYPTALESRSGLIIAFKAGAAGGPVTTPQTVTVTSATAVSASKRAGKIVAAVSACTVAAVKRANKAITAGAASVVTAAKRAGKTVAAASASAAGTLKTAAKAIAATSATTTAANATRAFLKTIAVGASAGVTLARRAGKAIGVASSGVVSATRSVTKTLAASAASAVASTVIKARSVVINATTASAASIRRAAGKSVAVSATGAVAMRRAIAFMVAVAATGTVSAAKAITKSIAASIASLVNVLRSIGGGAAFEMTKRVVAVAAQLRKVFASAETRSVAVVPETRSVSVKAEPRGVTPDGA